MGLIAKSFESQICLTQKDIIPAKTRAEGVHLHFSMLTPFPRGAMILQGLRAPMMPLLNEKPSGVDTGHFRHSTLDARFIAKCGCTAKASNQKEKGSTLLRYQSIRDALLVYTIALAETMPCNYVLLCVVVRRRGTAQYSQHGRSFGPFPRLQVSLPLRHRGMACCALDRL